MQVQAIYNQNNQTSFGAIYQPKNINFNKVQEPIAEAIKKAMREPLQKFKGETAEGFYKSKGLDFEITPHSSESVSLSAYKGMKETGRGVDKGYTYSDRLYIGEYNKNFEFRVSDIEAGIKDKNTRNLGFIAVALTAISSLLLIPTLSLNKKTQETTKPLIENVDSVANKAKTVLPDTTGVNKVVNTKVLKVIKK
jgi:hypothetical protein